MPTKNHPIPTGGWAATPGERMQQWKNMNPRCICTVSFLLNEDKHMNHCPMFGQ